MTPNGFASDTDQLVAKQIKELDALLGKKILPIQGALARADEALEKGEVELARGSNGREDSVYTQVLLLLAYPLKPKKAPKPSRDKTSWADNSLAAVLSSAQEHPAQSSLSDYIDQTPELAELKYAFLDSLEISWPVLPFDVRATIKEQANIRDYLIAYGYHIRKIRDVNALRNFVTQNSAGARQMADYAVVSAARALIDKEQLKVEHYNDDESEFVTGLVKEAVPLSALSYVKTVKAYIKEFVFDRDEEALIKSANIGPLPPGITPTLVRYIQNSPIEITKDNARHYLPAFVLQIMRTRGALDPETLLDAGPSDSDFEVQFQDDANISVEVSRSAVKCAAQFFHGMVLGDELDVFGAINYLTHKRLFGRGIRIESQILRNDLKMYVFDNAFIDLKSGQRTERTRPAERQMFHRQVFNQGHTQVPEDLSLNPEFWRLWKVLMLESARYLERAQASMNPESFVSRQNVMQAIEDLQYNLSANCTGMATILAPVADAELNFVLERILKHPEIIRQIVPEGGTWKQVIDKLNAEQRKPVGNAATLYNKAKLGQGIIQAVADYTPADFEDDGIFSAFISKVDAFITTQSILQRPKMGQLRDEHDEEDEGEPHETEGMPGHPIPPTYGAKPNGAANGATAGDWDF